MEPNVPLLLKTLHHVEALDRDGLGEWNQFTWRKRVITNRYTQEKRLICGTVMCFAGWTAELSGVEWVTGPEDSRANLVYVDTFELEGLLQSITRVEVPTVYVDGRPAVSVGHAARYLLGLSQNVTRALFAGGNDLGRLQGLVTLIVSGREAEIERLCDCGDYTCEAEIRAVLASCLPAGS